MHIYLDGSDKPTIIPGFNEVVKDMFERSDINGFIQDKKLHEPFNVVNLPNAPGFTGKSFNEYLDTYSGLVPECVSTKHHTKIYKVVCNPDYIDQVKFEGFSVKFDKRVYTEYDVDKFLKNIYTNESVRRGIKFEFDSSYTYDEMYRVFSYLYNVKKLDLKNITAQEARSSNISSTTTILTDPYAPGSTLPKFNSWKPINENY